MSPEGSVTHWLGQLKVGESAVAQPLWERYFRQLVRLARVKLQMRGTGHQAELAEEIATDAFMSFWRRATVGRFRQLENRGDLWSILIWITTCKVAHQIRDARRAKRGGGKVLSETDLAGTDAEDGEAVLAQIIGTEPTPHLAAEVAEESERLLNMLRDENLRTIARRRMEGYTVEEIATELGRSPRTVHLKLKVIRDRWQEEGEVP